MEERTKKDNLKFRLWEELGFIQITPGNVVDYKYIENDIIELSKNVTIVAASYDPHNASELVTNLIGAGLPMNKFPQGINYMSQPTKEFEKLVMSGKFLHDGNMVTGWMLSNVVIYTDANENIKPHRGKSANKIDGIISSINAIGGYLQLKLEGVNGTSVYDTREVRTL
jgi:phage terminase large subunit-like protein